MILSGRQIREGRALAGLLQADLAVAADVAVGLVVRVEASDGMAIAKKADLAAIKGALEDAGVEFLAHGEPSVRLQKAEPPHGKEDR